MLFRLRRHSADPAKKARSDTGAVRPLFCADPAAKGKGLSLMPGVDGGRRL
jgi:hypothetical protein